MAKKKKVKLVQVAVTYMPRTKKQKEPVSHVAAVDTKNRAWERFSDQPVGQWGQIEPPDEPERKQKLQKR